MEKLKKQWSLLKSEWHEAAYSSVLLESTDTGWIIQELYKGEVKFEHLRNYDGSRNTTIEQSLIGVTMLDLKNPICYVTEGVSDFIALKLMLPGHNVLGHTHLNWCERDVKFLSNFKTLCLISDNDNSGMQAVLKARHKFPQGKVTMTLPALATSKDVCDDFLRITTNDKLREHVINHYKTSAL